MLGEKGSFTPKKVVEEARGGEATNSKLEPSNSSLTGGDCATQPFRHDSGFNGDSPEDIESFLLNEGGENDTSSDGKVIGGGCLLSAIDNSDLSHNRMLSFTASNFSARSSSRGKYLREQALGLQQDLNKVTTVLDMVQQKSQKTNEGGVPGRECESPELFEDFDMENELDYDNGVSRPVGLYRLFSRFNLFKKSMSTDSDDASIASVKSSLSLRSSLSFGLRRLSLGGRIEGPFHRKGNEYRKILSSKRSRSKWEKLQLEEIYDSKHPNHFERAYYYNPGMFSGDKIKDESPLAFISYDIVNNSSEEYFPKYRPIALSLLRGNDSMAISFQDQLRSCLASDNSPLKESIINGFQRLSISDSSEKSMGEALFSVLTKGDSPEAVKIRKLHEDFNKHKKIIKHTIFDLDDPIYHPNEIIDKYSAAPLPSLPTSSHDSRSSTNKDLSNNDSNKSNIDKSAFDADYNVNSALLAGDVPVTVANATTSSNEIGKPFTERTFEIKGNYNSSPRGLFSLRRWHSS